DRQSRQPLFPLPLAVMERVAADLDKVAALQGAAARRLSGNVDLSLGVKKRLRAAELDPRVLSLDGIVLEKIDVRLLAAAACGDRLIEDELLARQRSGRNI